jgi:uncharacterized protein involved in exopolysaccharide biosynthesis
VPLVQIQQLSSELDEKEALLATLPGLQQQLAELSQKLSAAATAAATWGC